MSRAGSAAKRAAGTRAISAARKNFTRDLLTTTAACGLAPSMREAASGRKCGWAYIRLEYPKCALSPRRCVMAAQFAETGVSFQYPENWRLEREEIDHGWLVTVQSPGTSFLIVC